MDFRVWNSLFLKVLCIVLVLVSPASFAISQKVLEQSPGTIKVGLMALAIVVALLCVLVIVFKIQLSNFRKKQQKHNQKLADKQALFNDFKVGMLHVNEAGEIIFANRVAAFFLGSKEDKLISRPLLEMFSDDVQESISAALASNQYKPLQTYVAASRRHLQLGFSKQSVVNDGIASVISVADISNFQHQIDQQSSSLTSLNEGLFQSGLAKLTIDFESNTFTSDQLFADFLLAAEPMNGELNQLKKMLNSKATMEWEQTLELSKTKHQMDMSCAFLQIDKNQTVSQGSEPKEAQHQNTITLRLTGLSSNKNAKGETTRLDFLVQNLSELDHYKSLHQASQQQVNTLLATSSNPVYMLDEQGKFKTCNSAFELLFKQKLSKLENKNIQDLDILPPEISRLHTENSTNFSAVNVGHDKEFELMLPDEVLHTLKLKLKFFAGLNKKRAGVVGVIQDVTELNLAKKQLEQERKHFITILDLAPVAVATIDSEDRIVRANIAMTDRLGLSERELKKDTFYQLFNDSSNAGKAAKQIHQTGRLRGFVAQLKGKNDELHPSELHVDILNKETQEYLCWISDRTKEQFHQDKFDSLLQHSSMPMAILGEQGFSKLNPAACAFFNVEEEHELFGSTPFSTELNLDQQASEELERHITKVKLEGQAKSLQWEHRVGKDPLPCQATYVPMYKGQDFDSILCIWTDFRDLQQADEARIEAINLHQAAEKEVAEKQQLLRNSQDQLASKMKNLADTESRLQAAQDDLSEKQSEFSDLQQAHQHVTDNLQELQQDYNQSRSQLSEAQQANSALASQLQESTAKVSGLQAQRNQISDALQNSEKKYKTAQQELLESERNAEILKQEQVNQQNKMDDFVSEINGLKESIEQKDLQINEVGGQITSLQSELNSSGNTTEKLRQLLVNQRKASEEAEKQRRNLEQTYKLAESELTNKVRHVEHLQNEMQKFEEMSNQQKGDMQQQQSQLMLELEAKQRQLQETQQALDETKEAAEKEKEAKEQQQNQLEILQQELSEMENNSLQQQQKMAETEQEWQAQQQKIHQELAAKQQQLQETERTLQLAKEQSEAEKADKEQQLALFEKLQAELAEVEQRNTLQQQQIAQRDKEYQLQQDNMQQELKAKQQQLQETQSNLNHAKEQTEAEKKQQQTLFEKLQRELSEMEARNAQQQQQMAKSDEEWQLQQQKVQQELISKQELLQQTELLLSQTKQQTEAEKAAEKAEKEQQQALLEKLQSELQEMEQQSSQQQQKIAQSDQDWQKQQQALQDEVEAKRQQLQDTQGNLDEIKRQADDEKLARLEQQQKLEQLTVELTDVESRAVKQKEMIEGSDEQWRKHHAEIEQQKVQLQQALVEAEKQNSLMQQKLEGNLQQLQQAESQVSETQSGEQKLQDELNQARNQAEQLQQRIQQQEEHERKLQQQLEEQQQSLLGSEQNIHSLEEKQVQLTEQLQAVQQEYSNSKESLHDQHSDHAELAAQLQKLEQDLHNSQSQLSDKESALQQAKQELESNQAKLAEQENALLSAHKVELQQAIEQQPVQENNTPSEIAKIAMPTNPKIWFDLLPYLQNQNVTKPLPIALNELMQELENGIKETDNAVDEDDVTSILKGARKLVLVANKVNSEALTDVVTRLEADCREGLVDNIAISWPTVQRSLNHTLRVIYSHLHN
ncbi:PAS domain S-box protein [uncultured Paraglaciecola sp.]|uniref:PAS domain S-box protein n=1 Tax=uncultured Paraglaciecola sp. TaxID=1765024 RepID=UPI0030D8F701|tara:strand:+ start:10476 stop:15479 length:5004 start_codon:yes stop_codon:yes gene_type:complete